MHVDYRPGCGESVRRHGHSCAERRRGVSRALRGWRPSRAAGTGGQRGRCQCGPGGVFKSFSSSVPATSWIISEVFIPFWSYPPLTWFVGAHPSPCSKITKFPVVFGRQSRCPTTCLKRATRSCGLFQCGASKKSSGLQLEWCTQELGHGDLRSSCSSTWPRSTFSIYQRYSRYVLQLHVITVSEWWWTAFFGAKIYVVTPSHLPQLSLPSPGCGSTNTTGERTRKHRGSSPIFAQATRWGAAIPRSWASDLPTSYHPVTMAMYLRTREDDR